MKIKKLSKSKVALIIVITIYTILSFVNLGGNKNPQTFRNYEPSDYTYLQNKNNEKISKIKIYTGYEVSSIQLFLYENENVWEYIPKTFDSVFVWEEIDINSQNSYQYLLISSPTNNTAIGEIAAYNENGEKIELTILDNKDLVLVDEQNTIPKEISYMNSTYFDEVYFARTAYEQLNNLPIYESTHPPLGKILISIPVAIFGMTPFAYRLMGNIAGILMILVMYEIGKLIFKKEKYGVISAIIMALDGMHFVQTRIATVDSFLMLFCLTSFFFMMKYIYTKREEPLKKKLKYLLFSGIFIGMGIATKWTAFFAALGLAIIWLSHYIYNIVKYKFNKDDIKIVLFCILFFILIPICIYMASYIPLFINSNCSIKSFETFVEYQVNMFLYHSQLEATHPYVSDWYTWPILYKPVWFYVKYYTNSSITSTIACMGNPIIWWAGAISTVATLIYTIIKRKSHPLPLIVMILATWLTYMFIGRIMFLYHYFITLPYIMLMIVYILSKIEEKLNKKIFTIIFLILSTISFIYFYPVYSGKTVSTKYIEQTKWFSSWTY